MANFIQAIQWMKEGEKVKRNFWIKDFYFIHNGIINKNNMKNAGSSFFIEDYLADDWEVVK